MDEILRLYLAQANASLDLNVSIQISEPPKDHNRQELPPDLKEAPEQTGRDQPSSGNGKSDGQDAHVVQNQSGGVDISSETTAVGGDVVGRDKVTYIGASNMGEADRQRRIEATFPAQPVVGEIESLYVQVKMPESSVSLGARTRTMPMPFRADTGTGALLPTPFKIKIIAPSFRIHGGDERTLRVLPNEDSTRLEFQLQCETDQTVKIQVEVYAETGFLGQVDLPVTPMIAEQIPLPSDRKWIRGVFVLGTFPSASTSTSSW